jgi:hypothetical protein
VENDSAQHLELSTQNRIMIDGRNQAATVMDSLEQIQEFILIVPTQVYYV